MHLCIRAALPSVFAAFLIVHSILAAPASSSLQKRDSVRCQRIPPLTIFFAADCYNAVAQIYLPNVDNTNRYLNNQLRVFGSYDNVAEPGGVRLDRMSWQYGKFYNFYFIRYAHLRCGIGDRKWISTNLVMEYDQKHSLVHHPHMRAPNTTAGRGSLCRVSDSGAENAETLPPTLHIWVFPAESPPRKVDAPQQPKSKPVEKDLETCAAAHRDGKTNVDVPACAWDFVSPGRSGGGGG
ncbi:hypothetical protein MMC21_007273 [Puttea exsequens]|nr:hypothetical protein [Puttea exsequens]